MFMSPRFHYLNERSIDVQDSYNGSKYDEDAPHVQDPSAGAESKPSTPRLSSTFRIWIVQLIIVFGTVVQEGIWRCIIL